MMKPSYKFVELKNDARDAIGEVYSPSLIFSFCFVFVGGATVARWLGEVGVGAIGKVDSCSSSSYQLLRCSEKAGMMSLCRHSRMHLVLSLFFQLHLPHA